MEILKLSSKNFKEMVKITVRTIKNGQVAICPTDTVYGLVCDTLNKKAMIKLCKIKKRPKNKPIPIFVKDIKMAKKLAKIDKKQEQFLKKVWPGKTTVVLKKKNKKGTVGLRIPNHKLLLNLVKQLNFPLTGTSANISGQPASTKIKEILRQFEGQNYQPDLVLDDGDLRNSKPSTVIDLTIIPPKILRA